MKDMLHVLRTKEEPVKHKDVPMVTKCASLVADLFLICCERDLVLVLKFSVGLKSLLQQGLSELEFYGDLVYKFRKNICLQ